MGHIRVKAKVIQDDTGAMLTIPAIFMDHAGEVQPIMPLVQYFIEHALSRSESWMNRVLLGVRLLLEYIAANHGVFDKPLPLFTTFTQRIYTGTTGDDGRDPSGLYWLPMRVQTAKPMLHSLSEFSDWLNRRYGAAPLNPWTEASSYEQRLLWAAYINKSHRSFLGHLDSYMDASSASKKARAVKQRVIPTGSRGATKAFPEEHFHDLLFHGFVKKGQEENPDILERFNWRNICITALLHWGGLRGCEPFHLWVHDVLPDPNDPASALVRVYHPIEGAAPKDVKGPNGRPLPNREAYFKMRHPLYKPRNLESGNKRAGWKNPRLSDTQQKYMLVHWFPSEAGRFFMEAWKLYMFQRLRAKVDAVKHPFLFVSLHGKTCCEPYTVDAYAQSHKLAVNRIGLPYSKMNGTTKHGHRHAYGLRVKKSGAGSKMIQFGLHHKSEESQEIYTEPDIGAITDAMRTANDALSRGEVLPVANYLDQISRELSRFETRKRSVRNAKQESGKD